ncbi:FMN-binding protein [Actinacidiphila guanduensis]|uniref:FMN-binding domain-containing protein n=1 Tax=Actinacidiphila guanduensis TaxID=310781 RepID=A0A1G9V8U4_9ACTN|nr:FMN-binding protein [Actinacidiphila guanduensis]SDM68497.1 FMN-binding domain-containing protein [Actinacidiphila guanduensis]
MRKVVMALAATAGCIALLLGVKAQSAGPPRSALGVSSPARPGPTGGGSGTPSTGSTGSTAGGGGSGSAPGAKGTAHAPASGRFTGDPEDTPYGTVQVQAVLSGGRLTDVVVLQQTDGGRSAAIDAYALPVLKSEALKKQSANVDVVSGATYTSTGYARSLQAALDRAGR